MASIRYLWKNRVKHNLWSKAFLKSWAKRLFNFPSLIFRNYTRFIINLKGGKISSTAELNSIKTQGNVSYLTVGRNSFLGKIEIDLHDSVIIGNNVCLNDGVKILTASHEVNSTIWQLNKKPVVINDYAWVAKSAIIMPGVVIGKGAVVAAGAVVTKNVSNFEVVGGNPAKKIKNRVEHLDYNPCEWLAVNNAWLK